MGNISIARIVLLSMIFFVGCPANLAALAISVRSFRNNKLKSLPYLHLAFVDFVACFAYAGIAIVLESLDYIKSYNNREDLERFGQWEPMLRFLYEEVQARLFASVVFLSSMALTFIVGFRAWRIFNLFKWTNKYAIIGFLLFSDITIVLLAVFLTTPNRREPAACIDECVNNNDTETGVPPRNLSIHGGIPTVYHNGTFDQRFDHALANNSFMSSGSSGFPVALPSGSPLQIIMATSGASIVFTAVVYVLMCAKLRHEFLKSNFGEGTRRLKFLRRQVKHLVTHVIIMAIMLVMLLPGLLFAIVGPLGSELTPFMLTLTLANNALNPYVYCFFLPANGE